MVSPGAVGAGSARAPAGAFRGAQPAGARVLGGSSRRINSKGSDSKQQQVDNGGARKQLGGDGLSSGEQACPAGEPEPWAAVTAGAKDTSQHLHGGTAEGSQQAWISGCPSGRLAQHGGRCPGLVKTSLNQKVPGKPGSVGHPGESSSPVAF